MMMVMLGDELAREEARSTEGFQIRALAAFIYPNKPPPANISPSTTDIVAGNLRQELGLENHHHTRFRYA